MDQSTPEIYYRFLEPIKIFMYIGECHVDLEDINGLHIKDIQIYVLRWSIELYGRFHIFSRKLILAHFFKTISMDTMDV